MPSSTKTTKKITGSTKTGTKPRVSSTQTGRKITTTATSSTKPAARTRPTKKSTKSKSATGTATTTATGAATGAATTAPATPPPAAPKINGAITDYRSAMRWLLGHTDYERMRIVPYNTRTFNLDRMNRLLAALDNPHEQLKCVQIAGSKGKGSTCAMLGSMLRTCGYTVGLYTSPHLVDLRERISINDHMIPHADLTEVFKLIAAKYDDITGSKNPDALDRPSFFEIMTAAALRYFADQAVDIVVLETGLGGRLDSTTVVTPLVTAITHISLDHTNVLGDDVAAIAKEKAGIFKSNVPAITVAQEPEVTVVLNEEADAMGTILETTGKEIEFSYRFEASRELGPHTRVSITTASSRWEHLAVPLRGEHQAHNCALALSILDKLKGYGFNAPEEKVVEGLTATVLPGRMEQIHDKPRLIVDGAHNAVSIQSLIRALGAHISYDSLVMIFGCGQDKDVDGMLKQVSLGADKVIFTRAKSNPRAMEPADLIKRFATISGKMAQTADTLDQAIKLAVRAVSREDMIIVTGSFYLVGETKKYITDQLRKANK